MRPTKGVGGRGEKETQGLSYGSTSKEIKRKEGPLWEMRMNFDLFLKPLGLMREEESWVVGRRAFTWLGASRETLYRWETARCNLAKWLPLLFPSVGVANQFFSLSSLCLVTSDIA